MPIAASAIPYRYVRTQNEQHLVHASTLAVVVETFKGRFMERKKDIQSENEQYFEAQAVIVPPMILASIPWPPLQSGHLLAAIHLARLRL